MLGAKTDQIFGSDKREVHAGLEQKAVALPELVAVVALGVAVEVCDGCFMLADQDQRRVQGDAAAKDGQPVTESGAQKQGRRVDRATGADHHHPGPDPVLAGLPE